MPKFEIGDTIEVVDGFVHPYQLRGKIVEIDPADNPLEYGYAKIEMSAPTLPRPTAIVYLRNAKKVK